MKALSFRPLKQQHRQTLSISDQRLSKQHELNVVQVYIFESAFCFVSPSGYGFYPPQSSTPLLTFFLSLFPTHGRSFGRVVEASQTQTCRRLSGKLLRLSFHSEYSIFLSLYRAFVHPSSLDYLPLDSISAFVCVFPLETREVDISRDYTHSMIALEKINSAIPNMFLNFPSVIVFPQ